MKGKYIMNLKKLEERRVRLKIKMRKLGLALGYEHLFSDDAGAYDMIAVPTETLDRLVHMAETMAKF